MSKIKILMLGDTHGDFNFVSQAHAWAKKQDADIIFQLGDFGYWEHEVDGKGFLDALELSLDIPFFWLDGNHENHPLLERTYPTEIIDDDFGSFERKEVRKNLFFVPRGTSWHWDKLKFVALGGAYSVDKPQRLYEEEHEKLPHTLWWETETITDEQVVKAKSALNADVMLTHDAPSRVEVPGIQPVLQSDMNREKVWDVVQTLRPDILFHGHYHRIYYDEIHFPYHQGPDLKWHEVKVYGLGANVSLTMGKASCLFDTETKKVTRWQG